MSVPVQLSLFESDNKSGFCVGVPIGQTALRVQTTKWYESPDKAAEQGLELARDCVSDASMVVHDPTDALPENALGEHMTRLTNWSGAPFSSVVDHFAAAVADDWEPPFSLAYTQNPQPPYDIYTDGTHTPAEHQDDDRTEAGVGFVVTGKGDGMYACGLPAPHIETSLDSEYYAILSALMTVDTLDGASVHTDHRNVPTVANGVAPDRCAPITEQLTELFSSSNGLTIECVDRSATRLADGLATAGTRTPVTLGDLPQ